MRITGGQFGGIRLDAPSGPTRPTQDRVREAVFSILAPVLPGACVLDLFAGAGTLGLESASRGAACVCLVEKRNAAVQVIKQNTARLKGVQCPVNIVRSDVWSFLKKSPDDPFHIVFADPPYDRRQECSNLRRLLYALQNDELLTARGILVMEQSVEEPVDTVAGWELLRDKAYGATRIVMLQRGTGGSE